MIRKMLLSASLGGMLLTGVPAIGHSTLQDHSKKQDQQATKTVSGKVTSIGNDRRSFVLEADNGGTMQFVLDKNSQVEGRVAAGTMVLVEYQPTSGDQNLCVKVSARS